MKDPGITPMPWRAQTIPARAMRTPKMTAIIRMGSRTRQRPLSLGPCRVDPARTMAGLSRRSSRGLRARANSGTIPRSRMEERGMRGIGDVPSRRCECRAWNPPGSTRPYRVPRSSSRGRTPLLLGLENVVHRLHCAVLVEPRAPARSDVDDRDDEFSRADVARGDDLVGQAPISLESLRLLAWYDLHGPAVVRKVRRAFGVSVPADAA